MERLTENKIILIVKKTRLDELIARFNTEAQARFYIEHLGDSFFDYKQEDEQYKTSVAEAQMLLSRMGRVQILERTYLPSFIFGNNDTVVVIGQDGLVANTLKYLDDQPVIGVNPDPARWDGILLPFVVRDLPKMIPDVFSGRRQISEVTMAKATLGDSQILYAVNDFFIGAKSHISARYTIKIGSMEERHSSSGVIVSTGLGSTGWFKSLMAGAAAIASAFSEDKPVMQIPDTIPRNADYLFFTVREPFPSKISQASLVVGTVTQNQPLILISHMAESGTIFSDGIENDFLEFSSGTKAVITPAEKKGHLVV